MKRYWFSLGMGLMCSTQLIPASEDSLAEVIILAIQQETNLAQVDTSGPTHVNSILAVEMEHFFVRRDDEIAADSIEFELPAGATGVIPGEEFVFSEDGFRSSYLYESAVDDFTERFPMGDHAVTIRAEDGACVGSRSFLRKDFSGAAGPRTRVLNQSWRDGKLHLPKEALVLRWERMEPGLFVEGDSEGISQVRVSDAETGELVFSGTLGEVGYMEFAPFHLVGDHQGVFLSDQPDILEGRTYDVNLEQFQTTVVIEGNAEVETKIVSRLSFQMFVVPDAPLPPLPILNITTDDAAGSVSISWIPDADTDYFVAADDGLFLNHIPGLPLDLLITPDDITSELSFTESISGDKRRFYRVFPIPK